MNKIILIDLASLMFRAIFNWERQVIDSQANKDNRFILPAHYTYFNMILSALKKIHVEKDSIILGCQDGKSWRKMYSSEYKAQRQADREAHKIINWEQMYSSFNKLHEQLSEATNWHFVREWQSEADDIISVSCRFWKDKDVIIISSDGDLKQLLYYPNVKYFTVTRKCAGTNGMYVTDVKNPLSIISQKAAKGDISDNILVNKMTDTQEDAELRYFLVNLLELPDFVENAIRQKLENLPSKELHLEKLPPFKNAKERFLEIYNKEHMISYEYCEQLLNKRKERKKKEKESK